MSAAVVACRATSIPSRVVEERLREPLDFRRHRRREEQGLARERDEAADPLDVRDESHVEHPVGLIDDEDLDAREEELAALEMVEQPARRADENVDAARDLRVLVAERDAADEQREVELVVHPIAGEALLDLGGEFPRRLKDQRARHPRAGAALFEAREHGQRERGGLAGAGLGDAEHVAPGEDVRDRLALDRRRLGDDRAAREVRSPCRAIQCRTVACASARNLLVAFLPAAFFGLLLGKAVKARLFHPVPVALAFIVGGILILVVERWHHRKYGVLDEAGRRRARVESVDEMTALDALKVGLMQCLALVPGTSRSGSTIIGAMVFGFSRRCATEFSFYLGIPTLMAAGAYSVLKERDALHWADAPMFVVGTVVAFFSALLCIRWLIRYVSTHDFKVFAWYRIVFGGVVLLTAYMGWVNWID